MKEQFKEISFRPPTLTLIGTFNEVIDDIQGQGVRRMTLRQLYYQLVSRNVIANTPKEYRKMAGILSDARYAGLVDWDAIEDRGRRPTEWQEYDSAKSAVDDMAENFRLERWKGQSNYVELWVEKDALASVLTPIASEFHVPLQVNKGYSSTSAMKDSTDRIQYNCSKYADDGERCQPIVFYLGDHDPSGEDMVRDIRERFATFGLDDIDVRKLALTTAQVRQYKPPPNPAKVDDPRASSYIAQFGPTSWEVDALPPRTLRDIIVREFRGVIDQKLLDLIKKKEKTIISRLTDVAEEMSEESEE